jgi:hypothetical protein
VWPLSIVSNGMISDQELRDRSSLKKGREIVGKRAGIMSQTQIKMILFQMLACFWLRVLSISLSQDEPLRIQLITKRGRTGA